MERTDPELLRDARILDSMVASASVGAPEFVLAVEVAGVQKSVAATAVRYAKVLSDIIRLVGTDVLNAGALVVEIGGGYGGQAGIVLARFPHISSWAICDLPPAELLQMKYAWATLPPDLAAKVHRCPMPHTHVGNISILISNYALSELGDLLRRDYIDGLVPHASYGYFIWNAGDTNWIVDALTSAGRANIEVRPEEPRTSAHNMVVTWGPSQPSRTHAATWAQLVRSANAHAFGSCNSVY